MPTRRGRLAIAAVVAVVPLTLLTASAARAAAPRLTMAVTAGYPAIAAQAGEWIPVTLDLRAGDSDVNGQVDVTTTDASGGQQNGFGGGTTCYSTGNGTACSSTGPPGFGFGGQGSGSAVGITYRLPVVLAAGTAKRLTVYVIAGGTGVDARVTDGSGVLAEKSVSASMSFGTTTTRVAVVSDTPGALSGLAAIKLFDGSRVEPVDLTAASLPDTAIALSAFAAVVVDGASTASLTPDQRQALTDMVVGGGALVVAGGGAAQTTAAGLPRDLLPADVGAVATVPGLPRLAALLGAPAVAPLDAVTLTPARGGRVTVRDGDLAMVVEADRGAGRVVQVAVDPRVEPLASWSGTIILLRQVLTRAQRAAPVLAAATTSPGLQVRPVPLGWADSLAQAVGDMPALDLPSPLLVGSVLILYLLLVGPINYLVLRRLRRRDLMWVTVPALALLGTVVAYTTGVGIRGNSVVLSEVRVVTFNPGDARGLVESYGAAFSPRGGNATLRAGGATAVGGMSGLATGAGTVVALAARPATVQLEGSSTASVHGFSAATYAALKGRVVADVHLVSGHLAGTVTNHLGVPLTDATLVSSQGVGTLSTIPDGGTVTVDVSAIAQGGNGPNFPPNLLPGGGIGVSGPGASAAERDAVRRQEVLAALSSGLAGSSALGSPAAIVAVAGGSVAADTAAGDGVTVHDLDAVVIPLDDTSTAANPFPPGEVVDEVANPADATLSDSIVQYRVAAANPAIHLDATAATQNSNCPAGAPPGAICGGFKGPVVTPTPASPTQPLGCDAFNQATGSWVPVPLSSTSTADIAAAAAYVSPDGLLLLRVRAGYGGVPVLHVTAGGTGT